MKVGQAKFVENDEIKFTEEVERVKYVEMFLWSNTVKSMEIDEVKFTIQKDRRFRLFLKCNSCHQFVIIYGNRITKFMLPYQEYHYFHVFLLLKIIMV